MDTAKKQRLLYNVGAEQVLLDSFIQNSQFQCAIVYLCEQKNWEAAAYAAIKRNVDATLRAGAVCSYLQSLYELSSPLSSAMVKKVKRLLHVLGKQEPAHQLRAHMAICMKDATRIRQSIAEYRSTWNFYAYIHLADALLRLKQCEKPSVPANNCSGAAPASLDSNCHAPADNELQAIFVEMMEKLTSLLTAIQDWGAMTTNPSLTTSLAYLGVTSSALEVNEMKVSVWALRFRDVDAAVPGRKLQRDPRAPLSTPDFSCRQSRCKQIFRKMVLDLFKYWFGQAVDLLNPPLSVSAGAPECQVIPVQLAYQTLPHRQISCD